MIAEATKVKEAIEQAFREVNDACLQLRSEGVVCLLPEFIDFEVNMVTGTDINAVTRSSVDSDAGGSTVTTRSQKTPDSERIERSGDVVKTDKSSTNGSDTTKITHPSVVTTGSGADNSDETVTYDYEK